MLWRHFLFTQKHHIICSISSFTLIFSIYFCLGLCWSGKSWSRSYSLSFCCKEICRNRLRLLCIGLRTMRLWLDLGGFLLGKWNYCSRRMWIMLWRHFLFTQKHHIICSISSFTLIFSSDFCIGLCWSRKSWSRIYSLSFGCKEIWRNYCIMRCCYCWLRSSLLLYLDDFRLGKVLRVIVYRVMLILPG